MTAKSRAEKPSIEVAAIHRINISVADVQQRLSEDPHWTSLTLDYLLDITGSLYLIDLGVRDLGASKLVINEITQDNDMGQAPFGEQYFLDGSHAPILNVYNMPDPGNDNTSPGHVRFFMHYFNPDLGLKIGDETLPLPVETSAPDWLLSAMPYQPPN
jgi:hypothetical protein